MTGALTWLGLSQRVAAKVAPWAVIALLAGLAVLVVVVWDYFDDEAAIKGDRLEANAEALGRGMDAVDAAAHQRALDAIADAEQKKELDDAITNPRARDSVDPGVRLACQQLRRDGQDTTAIPECGGR